MPRRMVGLLSALALVAGGAVAAAAAGGSSVSAGLPGSLAGRCVALRAPNGRFVAATSATRYAASGRQLAGAGRALSGR